MRRSVTWMLGALLLTVLLSPPWRLVWSPASGGSGPVTRQATWAGFHRWTFAGERHSTVVAWDGPGTGGQIPMEGVPTVALDLWAALLLLSGGAWYAAARRIGGGA